MLHRARVQHLASGTLRPEPRPGRRCLAIEGLATCACCKCCAHSKVRATTVVSGGRPQSYDGYRKFVSPRRRGSRLGSRLRGRTGRQWLLRACNCLLGVVGHELSHSEILLRKGGVAPKATEGEDHATGVCPYLPLCLASASHLPLAGEDRTRLNQAASRRRSSPPPRSAAHRQNCSSPPSRARSASAPVPRAA